MLMKTLIQHACPSCGRLRKTPIGAGWVRKDTTCLGCHTTYELTRDMRITGLDRSAWHNNPGIQKVATFLVNNHNNLDDSQNSNHQLYSSM